MQNKEPWLARNMKGKTYSMHMHTNRHGYHTSTAMLAHTSDMVMRNRQNNLHRLHIQQGTHFGITLTLMITAIRIPMEMHVH